MKYSSTKPARATSYKDTAFGIIPREKLLQLEIEGTKKGLEYIYDVVRKNRFVVCDKMNSMSYAFSLWGYLGLICCVAFAASW